ncbi:MAG: nucleotide excision repair endonuclease [Balneolaceae bacterium]|nr:nucleotide excision repair endonuclease [Balneolaceae bacterium]
MLQQTLFPAEPFLKAKFGSDLFSDVPNSPGIYRFYNSNNELIYVGKSKNLRNRLFSYRTKRVGFCSRKESRLIRMITSWEIAVFESEREAILEENRLIRKFRPLYNHANKSIETYYYIRLKICPDGVIFLLSMNPDREFRAHSVHKNLFASDCIDKDLQPERAAGNEEYLFGCFKGHLTVRRSFGALLHLLWMRYKCADPVQHLPVKLTRNLAPYSFFFPLSDGEITSSELRDVVVKWFLGESDYLLDIFEGLQSRQYQRFTQDFIRDRLEILQQFYQHTLDKHRKIRDQFYRSGENIIPQYELDDMMVKLQD